MKKRVAFLIALVLSGFVGSALAAPVASIRPASWAAPVLDTGVENLYRIESDLYRSARPDNAGFQKLAALGIKAVLDVAGGNGDASATRGTPLKLFHVPMTAWGLRDDRVLQALRVLGDPQNRPVLIHCQHGADRTGAIVALYRVVVQGWSKAEAIREMNEGGYHHSSFFGNLDRYVLGADVSALRRQLGILAPVASLTGTMAQAGRSAALSTAPQTGEATTISTETSAVRLAGASPVDLPTAVISTQSPSRAAQSR